MGTYRLHPLNLLFVTVFISSCASSTKAPIVDYREERFTVVTEQLAMQRKKIEFLTAELKELKRKVSQAPAPTPVVAKKTSQALPKRAKKSISTSELKAAPVERKVASPDGELVADSSFESMHLYFRGMQLRKDKKLDEAINAFREFYENFPDHIYADRAHYMVVQSLYDNREYQLAIVAANQMLGRFPHSFRIPEAIYYRSMSYREMGAVEEANDGFRELIQGYPKTEWARLSREYLGSMGQRSASAPKLLDRTTQ